MSALPSQDLAETYGDTAPVTSEILVDAAALRAADLNERYGHLDGVELLRVLLTGEREGWYAEFDAIALMAKAFRRPHVHDGTYSEFRKRRFGAPADDVPAERFVVFSADHDQVGNRALGDRLPVEARPLAAFCTLLSPFTPMLFMGEEYGETAPCQFFTDHIDPDIAEATREGRRRNSE